MIRGQKKQRAVARKSGDTELNRPRKEKERFRARKINDTEAYEAGKSDNTSSDYTGTGKATVQI